MNYGLTTVTVEKLRLSRAPAAEIAAAAVVAQKAAGLPQADFVVIALDPNETEKAGRNVATVLEETLRAAK